MATRKPKPKKQVTTLTYDDASRKNIPTAEFQKELLMPYYASVSAISMKQCNRLRVAVKGGD